MSAPGATARPTLPTLAELATLGSEEALHRLDSDARGLTAEEARRRLALHGENRVATEARRSLAWQLLRQFLSPLPLLLLGIAVVADLTGEARGAVVIGVMVVLSVVLSFVQEARASRAAERLRAMVHVTATVLRREGEVTRREEIPLAQVVPGDVVQLSAGDLVPADLRLIAARDLFLNEAALTGESLPVEKHAQAVAAGSAPANLCYLGSHVLSGAGTGLVVDTGAASRFGAVAHSIVGERPPTAFALGVRHFVWLIMRFMAVMVPLVFVINGLARGDWFEAFLFALAVAVGLAPEMLPMIVTVNLAKGALALSRKQVIVRRLDAIQNLGAIDVLCTDKTGTLTQDRVLLQHHVDLADEESERVLELATLNSLHQTGLRNLLDVAVIDHATACAVLERARAYAKVDEIPFDFARRRMSVIVRRGGETPLLVCKGAVQELLAACESVETPGGAVPLTSERLAQLRALAQRYAEDGFRVIAVASRPAPPRAEPYGVADERGLSLAGFVAFLDPPKDSAGAAITALRRLGVAVKVLTGDSEVVARKVCHEVGLDAGAMLVGSELEALDDAALGEAAERAVLFARLAPEHKARVIRVLRARGRVVGFLGDGINDGPALRAADVGISVDSAVDIAKESADIILLEKSLTVLARGVREGRRVFANILKYLRITASSNFGNMLSVLGASAFLPFLPMLPVQVLLNNFAYDVGQTAVATDRVDPAFLEHPRRWDVGAIGRAMVVLGPVSSLFDYLTFGALWWLFDAGRHPALFQTGWFVESLLSQTLVVHVLRTAGLPFVESRPSNALLLATGAICATAIALPYSPLAGPLGLVALPAAYWPVVAVIVGTYLLSAQLAKRALVRHAHLA